MGFSGRQRRLRSGRKRGRPKTKDGKIDMKNLDLTRMEKMEMKDLEGQFFHILGSVDQQRGCCEVTEGKYEITIYTSCCNTAKGIYYYTTYDNHQITAVDMHAENLDSDQLICYPLLSKGEVRWQNK